MKKYIVVVTCYMGENYGTKLQALSLCKCFEELGCEVQIISHFRPWGFLFCHPQLLLNRLICKLNHRKRKKFFTPSVYNLSLERERRLLQFERDNYNAVNVSSYAVWRAMEKKKPTFVVGSDIIWQPVSGPPGYYFLDFAYKTGMKKYSYATSIGANELPKKYYPLYRKYLNDFDGVSVREQKAADMLNEIVDIEVRQQIDPTLLHTADFWDQYAEKADIPENIHTGQYILCYFVMEDGRYWDYVSKVVQETGYQAVILPMHDIDEKQPYTILTEGTPYEFIWLIKNSAFICTDSLHACTFSLNYKKEFYLLRRTRKDEDAKYDDFLARYHLTERVVKDESCFERKPDTDYETAHRILETDRSKALSYIQSML